jgi:outer membrane protein assembly factor BamE (lipoprotein component of BamABCDE complex)
MKWAPTLILTVALSGCASFAGPQTVRSGETQSDVRAKLGAPSAERKLASGDMAWYYVTGPSSFFTYRVVFGRAGSVTDYSQVLTRKDFTALPPGATQAAVLDALGPPMERMTFHRTATEVWTYRWLEGTFVMLADAVFDIRKGTLSDVVLRRDPIFESGISPD